jgi:RNA polymerase sigma-70 factor (ECF subfamily)
VPTIIALYFGKLIFSVTTLQPQRLRDEWNVDTASNSEVDALMQRVTSGDPAALSELLDCYRDRLRRMIAIRLDRRIYARVDPSDVVQETLVDAHRRMPEFLANSQISFYPWLRRIANDRLIDVHRVHLGAGKRSVLREDRWKPPLSSDSVVDLAERIVAGNTGPEQDVLRAEMQQRAINALMELKVQDREILVLRYLEGLGVRDIAEVLEITETAVTSRQLRALQKLRRLMN